MNNKFAIMIFGALAVVVADQVTKIAVISHLKDRQTVPLIDNFLSLTFVGNKGAAFGLFSGYNIYFFLIVSAFAIGFILYFFWTIDNSRTMLASGLSLIMGGALGNNLIDRVRLGYVVDFIDVHHQFSIIDYNFVWPKFNVADMAILIGVALFLFDMIKNEQFRQPAKDA